MEDYEKIHELQRQHTDNDPRIPERKDVHDAWFRTDTVDFWRHERMYETLRPLASFYRDRKWLSIGDGRYGLDSYRLRSLFNVDVFPTDISGSMLEKGKQLGLIREYAIENAERLTFPDNSFDIVFCKESFHHLPRPILALYEMIRVAKSAVILIEPNDPHLLTHPKKILKVLTKTLWHALSGKGQGAGSASFFRGRAHSFEDSGSYLYPISRREIEKLVHGLNLKGLASKGLNDHYIKGCEFERAAPDNEVFKKIKGQIERRDFRCRLLPLFFDWDLLTLVVFKREVDGGLRRDMESSGYSFSETIPNPYV